MNQVRKFLAKLYRGVGTTRAKRLERLIESSEWALLQKERVSAPSTYQNSKAYFKDALVVEITRKLALPGDDTVRRQAAIDSFWASEAQCYQTNVRLARYINKGPYEPNDIAVEDFINLWRKEVSRVLGKLPEQLTPAFSAGSTLSDQGKLTTIPDKMSSQRTVYATCLDIHQHAITGTVLDHLVAPTIVRGNRFFTVLKDSEKHRGCCVEASGAIFCQLAVGKLLKLRYQKAYGVNLLHAQPLHQSLAKQASIDGKHATIDLSNASDTVSRQLVKLLLPDLWYELLNSLRAHRTWIDGRWVYLEKFSSMGNGFTFELETIIFRSLIAVLGCPLYEGCVFGDDIIVPTELASDVKQALKYFGFTLNERKTFCEGPFRESCGGDFFDGVAVRPHYLKELPDEPQHWVALANGLRRADPNQVYTKAAWWFCVEQVPLEWRNFGPASLGDLLFYDPLATPKPRKCKTPDNSGYDIPHWRVMRPVSRSFALSKYWTPDVQLAFAVLGGKQDVTPRNDILGYRSDYVPAWGVEEFNHWHRLESRGQSLG